MDSIAIGKTLRELRGIRSIVDVCKDLDISPSALSMYEHGERIPRDEIKIRIAEYYGRSVGDIFFAQSAHES
jgi:transcriptional regulator with XRE-family HTH domain